MRRMQPASSLFLIKQCLSNKVPEKLYLLTDNEPVRLYDLLNWIRQHLNLNKSNKPNSRQVLGKRLRSSLIPNLQFKYKYPSYKNGYIELIQVKKTLYEATAYLIQTSP